MNNLWLGSIYLTSNLSRSEAKFSIRMKSKTVCHATIVFLFTLNVYCWPVAGQSEYAGRGGVGASNSVYRIICFSQNRSGTAFGHKSGRIITAEHVANNCDAKDLIIIDTNEHIAKVTSIVSDARIDVAILTPTLIDFVKKPLSITNQDSFDMGAQVSTWGFPAGYGGKEPMLTVGYLAGISEQKDKQTGTVVRQWIVNGAFNPGNSGGPVLETKNATVIGVISSKARPILDALDKPDNLEKQLLELEKSGSSESKILAKLIQALRNQTQLVIGYATITEELRKFLKANNIDP